MERIHSVNSLINREWTVNDRVYLTWTGGWCGRACEQVLIRCLYEEKLTRYCSSGRGMKISLARFTGIVKIPNSK